MFFRKNDSTHVLNHSKGSDTVPAKTIPLLRRLFPALGLDRAFRGSVLRHPWLFCGMILLLVPFFPTMGILALLVLLMIALLVERGCTSEICQAYSPTASLGVLLAVVYLCSIAASVLPKDSLWPGFVMCVIILGTMGVFQSIRRFSQLRACMAAAAIGSILISCYGIWQWFFAETLQQIWLDTEMFGDIQGRVYATFTNPNMFGSYLIMALPLCGVCLMNTATWRKRILWGIGCVIITATILLTYSRGCYLALIAALTVFLLMTDRRFALLIIPLLAAAWFLLPDSIISRFASLGNMVDTSTMYRVNIWKGSLEALRHFWFCGIGPGETAFRSVFSWFDATLDAPHSHSLYLQLLCDTGITGLLCFLAMTGWLLTDLVRIQRRSKNTSVRLFARGLVTSVTALLVYGLADSPFYNYRVATFFFALLGLGMRLRDGEALAAAELGDIEGIAPGPERKTLVLHVISDTNIGGAGKYLLNLCATMDREKYSMVLALPLGSALRAPAEEAGIPVLELSMPGDRSWSLRCCLAIRQLCIALRPDIIQTHGSLSARIAARACSGKLIYTRHSAFPVSRRLSSGLGHIVTTVLQNRYTDLAVAVSPAAEENLLALGLNKQRIVTMMNGAPPLEKYSAERRETLRNRYGLSRDTVAVGLIARLEFYKGQSTLVRAAETLIAEGRQIHVYLAGTGSGEAELRKQIEDSGLQQHVTLCGFVEDVTELMNVLDIQVNASSGTETSSIAIIEGMSISLPAVVSDYGGNPWLIEHEVSGLIFPTGDSDALAVQLRLLMDHPELRENLGRGARVRYEDQFTAEKFAEQMDRVYDTVLGKEDTNH